MQSQACCSDNRKCPPTHLLTLALDMVSLQVFFLDVVMRCCCCNVMFARSSLCWKMQQWKSSGTNKLQHQSSCYGICMLFLTVFIMIMIQLLLNHSSRLLLLINYDFSSCILYNLFYDGLLVIEIWLVTTTNAGHFFHRQAIILAKRSVCMC